MGLIYKFIGLGQLFLFIIKISRDPTSLVALILRTDDFVYNTFTDLLILLSDSMVEMGLFRFCSSSDCTAESLCSDCTETVLSVLKFRSPAPNTLAKRWTIRNADQSQQTGLFGKRGLKRHDTIRPSLKDAENGFT